MRRLLLRATISAVLASAHQFHFGHIDANWNSRAKTLELSVRLHADDLEDLLRQRQGRPLELDRDPQAEKLACAYALETVAFDRARFRCLGMEVTTHQATLYLEAPAAEAPRRGRFRSFSTAFPDQINTVQLLIDNRRSGSAIAFLSSDEWKPLRP
jgi:hypothetical protein